MNTVSATLPGRFKSNAIGRSAQPVLTWRATQNRSKLVLGVLILGFSVVVVRAFQLQLVNADQWEVRADNRFTRGREIPATRGRVLDRNGQVIASSVQEEMIAIIPGQFFSEHKKIDDKKLDLKKTEALKQQRRKQDEKKIQALAEVLGMKPEEVRSKIASSKRYFYLARGLDIERADKIRRLRMEGVQVESDFRRYYPYGDAFAHVVGFTNSEERGAEGLEAKHDAHLRGSTGQAQLVIDRTGTPVEAVRTTDASPGKDLQLSLDASIQTIVQSALKAAVIEHRPRAASAVVLDSQTGEVLALVNEPSFDPNNRARLSPDTVRNRVITDTFEPGSTMKSFSIATALELGRVTPKTEIPTAPGKLTIGNRTIGDSHPHGTLTVEEVLAKSSNVGTVKIAQRMTPKEMHDVFSAVGFGRIPDVGLNGATPGRLRNPDKWVPIEQATMSYGHGISVSLLQLARAYTIFARDGDIVPVSFVPQPGPVAGIPVISASTAAAVRKMLIEATGPQGTAPKAQIEGFRVAGKTGTAHKAERGGYSKTKFVASFVGFVPADKPRFVIAVMVDEPSTGRHYGGDVAAPIFAKIADDTLRRMQISPNPALRVLPAVAFIGEGTQ